MTQSDDVQLLILDQTWQPRARLSLANDWRSVICRLLGQDGEWLMLYQQRAATGAALPHAADIALTCTLSRRLQPLDIRLADHWIDAGENRFSFRAAGLL